MKKIASLLTTAVCAVLLSAPASADSLIHLWSCKLNEGGTNEDLVKLTEDWLKGVKSMDGGAELRVLLEYPMAADAGLGEFTFVLIAPDATTWGTFMDGYDMEANADVDEAWNEVASCSSSGIWQSVEISAD